MSCPNVKDCPCVKIECPNHGKCCDCVANHKEKDLLPACLRNHKQVTK